MGKRRSSSRQRWSIARVLAVLGGLVALAGFAYGFFLNIIDLNVLGLVWQALGAVISIFVLIQMQVVKSKIDIPFNWWMLLIFVCLQAITASELGQSMNFVSITGLGLLLEVIAVLLLLFNAM